MPQLSQKCFWYTVGGFVALELLSWFAYSTGTMNIVFLVVAAGILVLAWLRPTWLALASLAELVVGSKGFLLFGTIAGQTISLRMLLFTGLLLAIVRLWPTLKFDFPRSITKPLLFLLGWVVVMTGWGIARGNALAAVYSDVNAWLYLGVFFGWWAILRKRTNWKAEGLTILLAGGTLIGLKSWVMMVLFGQNVSNVTEIYRWVRNTGVGEITLISDNIYRVFFQSQVYALLVFTITFVGYLWRQVPRWWAWPMIASALGVYFSLSRSFWLGLIAAMIIIVMLLVKHKGWVGVRRLWMLVPLCLVVWLFNSWALNWPYVFNFSGGPRPVNTVVARLSGKSSIEASTARRNQIQPLVRSIAKHPVIGSGFGTTVTYYSTDPRVKGWRTTTAFELGYLDLWLKIGLIGVALYAWWLWRIYRKLRQTHWLIYFFPGIVALVITHLTSPYLNHPLGLGWLAFVSLYAADA